MRAATAESSRKTIFRDTQKSNNLTDRQRMSDFIRRKRLSAKKQG